MATGYSPHSTSSRTITLHADPKLFRIHADQKLFMSRKDQDMLDGKNVRGAIVYNWAG